MTISSVIPTKINLPPIRKDVVYRARALGRLNEGVSRSSALTLVSAPAGYGKTTLAVSWLRGLNQPYAWLSLDADDDNLPRFITCLVSALQKVNPSIGKTAGRLIESFRSDASQTDSILSSLVEDVTKHSQPIHLVLEDYHVIQSSLVHAFIEGLIEHARPQLHVLLTTRSDPPLPLARWRVRDQLTEIRTSDLQFTLEEAAEFLQQVMELKISEMEIHALEERTEGWVAGLQLAALSIRNRQNKSENWILEGGQRDIADYLMTEVVGQLPVERREFLLQTSLVSRLNASLGNTLTGGKDSQQMLEALEADNLFTLPLDDSREWFRYHQLFAEFLYNRLLAEYPNEFVQGLHQRASRWFEKQGDRLSAIDHALSARDYEYAACLIGPQAEEWMRHGEISTILGKLEQLPDELVRTKPALCIWYGWVYAITDSLDLAEKWTGRAEACWGPCVQPVDEEHVKGNNVLRNAYAQILAIRALIARRKSDFEQAITLAEQSLQIIPEDNINLRAVVSAGLSSARMEAGDFDRSALVTSSAQPMAHRAANPFILFTLLMNESAIAIMRGKLMKAHEVSHEALRLTESGAMRHLSFLPHIRLGRVHYFWNQLAEARQHLQEGFRTSILPGYSASMINGYINLALVQHADGESALALNTLLEASALARSHNLPVSDGRVKGLAARIRLSAGETEAFTYWLKSSGWDAFDPFQPGPAFNDESFFALCRHLISLGNPLEWERLEGLLEWRLKDSEKQERGSTILEIRLTQALFHQAKHQPGLAITALIQALELAEPEHTVRPFIEDGKILAPLLRRIPKSHPTRGFAQQLLLNVDPGAPRQISILIESLGDQELSILRLMALGHTNPEIARMRVLAVSTVRWYAKQIFRKLGVHNRTQAAAQARKLNLF